MREGKTKAKEIYEAGLRWMGEWQVSGECLNRFITDDIKIPPM